MKKFLSVITGIVIAFCILYVPISAAKADDRVVVGDLTVHFIDVGQGDSCFVELPDGRTMLIDAGKKEYGKTVENYINENIRDDDGNKITFVDFVVFTHSDADHIGGMSYVLDKFDAGVVYRSNEECVYEKDGKKCSDPALTGKEERNRFWGDKRGSKKTATYHEAIEQAYKVADEVIVTNPADDTQNVITSIGDKKYTINFYSPLGSYYTDLNNYSPIIVIDYRSRRIVLSGDAEQKNEEEFVQKARSGEGRYSVFDDAFCADVIKLGHHGSRTSSSEDYLDVMTTKGGRSGVFVIISCGTGNTYGHPHKEVIDRLLKMGFSENRILRTDEKGDIVIAIAEKDGMYQTVYVGGEIPPSGGQDDPNTPSGGEGGQDDPNTPSGGEDDQGVFDSLIDKFNRADTLTKIAVIVAAIAAVAIVSAILIYASKKRKAKRKKRRK